MTRNSWLKVAGAVFILAYFLFFTWRGLSFPFDNDDMFSIYMGWTKPWSELLAGLGAFWRTSFRPLGLLFYSGLYEAFGFQPLPFRIACLSITALNILLCYRFVRLVSRSARIAVLTALLFAFHSRLMEVWFRTAIIYDILCFTFFYTGLCLYIDGRQKRQALGLARSALVLLCFLAAIDSKEMAVAFPVILLAWELTFHGLRTNLRRFVPALVAGLIGAGFILSKTYGGAATMADPAFTPSYTLARFEQNWNGMLTHLILLRRDLGGPICLYLLCGLFLVSAVLRNRLLVFAAAIAFVTALPFVFIPPRGGYVLYIPYVGWTLWAATIIVAAEDLLIRRWAIDCTRLAIFVFLLIAWRWGKANLHDQRADREKAWLYSSPRAIDALVSQVAAPRRSLPLGASMLFLNDGFGTDEWTPVFVLRLYFEDQSLVADRLKMINGKPENWDAYQLVFDFQDGKYLQRKP